MRLDTLALASILMAVAAAAPTEVGQELANKTEKLNEVFPPEVTGQDGHTIHHLMAAAASGEAANELMNLSVDLEDDMFADNTEIAIEALPQRGWKGDEYANDAWDDHYNDNDYQQDYHSRLDDFEYNNRRANDRQSDKRREKALSRNSGYRQAIGNHQTNNGGGQRYQSSGRGNYGSNDRFAESLERSKYGESLERASRYRGSYDGNQAMHRSGRSPAGDHHDSYSERMDDYAKQRQLNFEDQMRARDHEHEMRSRTNKEESGLEAFMREMGWAGEDEEEEPSKGLTSHSRIESATSNIDASVNAKEVKAADEGGFSFTDLYDELFGDEEASVLGYQFIAEADDYYDDPDSYVHERGVRRLGHDHHGGHSHNNHHGRPHDHGSHFWWDNGDECCDECCCDECCDHGGWFGFSQTDNRHGNHHHDDYDSSFFGGRDGDEYEDKDDRWFTRERDTERREERYDEYQRDLAREFEKGREFERFQMPERPHHGGFNEYERAVGNQRYRLQESQRRPVIADQELSHQTKQPEDWFGDDVEDPLTPKEQRQRMRERAQQRGQHGSSRRQLNGAEGASSIRQIQSRPHFSKDPRFSFSNASDVETLSVPDYENVVARDIKSAIGSSPPALAPLSKQRFNSSSGGGLSSKAILENGSSSGRKKYQSHPGQVAYDPLNPTPFYNPLTNEKIYPHHQNEEHISNTRQPSRGSLRQDDRMRARQSKSVQYRETSYPVGKTANEQYAHRQLSFDKTPDSSSYDDDWVDDPRFIDDGYYEESGIDSGYGSDMGDDYSHNIDESDCYEPSIDDDDDQSYYWSSEDNVFADDEDPCDDYGNLKSGFSPFPGYPRYTPLGGIPNPVPDSALSSEERVERWHQENLERKRTNRLKAMEERRNHEKAQRSTESRKENTGGSSLPYFTTSNMAPSIPNNNLDLSPASSQRYMQSRSKLSSPFPGTKGNRPHNMRTTNKEHSSPRARNSYPSGLQNPWFRNSSSVSSGSKRLKMLGGHTGSERVEVPKYRPQPKSKLPYFKQPMPDYNMKGNLRNSTRSTQTQFESGFEDAELTFDDPAFYPIPEQPQYDTMDDYRLRDDSEFIDEDIELSIVLSEEEDSVVETQLVPVKPPRYAQLRHEDDPEARLRRGPTPRPAVHLNPQRFGHVGARNTSLYESERQPRSSRLQTDHT